MTIKTEHEALVSRKITSQLLWRNQQCYFLKQQTLLIYRNLIFLRDNYELDPAVNITYLEREEMSWLTHCPVTPVSVRAGIPSPSSLSPAPTFQLKQVIPHLDLFTVLPHIHSLKKKKKTEGYLIYNVIPIFVVQESDSVIHIETFFYIYIPFHYGLL